MIKYLLLMIFIAQNLAAQSFWDMDPKSARDDINNRIMSISAVEPKVDHVSDQVINIEGRTTPIRIYYPNNNHDLPVILMIHGGGWVAGNLDTHDYMARYLCHGVQAIVVSVGYENSPEGKFPIPLEQCYDGLVWISKNADKIQGNSKEIAVVGDSAGGNMAAALCLLARDRTGPKIALQVLVNPAPDLTGGGTLLRQGDALDTMRWFAAQYVSDPKDTLNPYVSPLMSKDLHNLPPALVILAEKDEILADGKKYADQLIAAGVPTNIYIQWGIGHLAGNGARAANAARESLDVAVAALRGVFYRQTN
jgi:acetyl esterase